MKTTYCPICFSTDKLPEFDISEETPLPAVGDDKLTALQKSFDHLYRWHLHCRNYWNQRNSDMYTLLEKCAEIAGAEICSLPKALLGWTEQQDDRRGDKRRLKQENAELRALLAEKEMEIARMKREADSHE